MQRKKSKVIILSLIFLFAIGCIEQTKQKQGTEKINFSTDYNTLQSLYKKAGLSQKTIQRIESGQLFTEKEKSNLLSSLSSFEQKVGSFEKQIQGYSESSEKNALLDLIQINLSRAEYLKKTVKLKANENLAPLIESINSLPTEPEEMDCTKLSKAKDLEREFETLEQTAYQLSEEIRLFKEEHPQVEAPELEDKKPTIEKNNLNQFIPIASLLHGTCNSLKNSLNALTQLEEFSEKENLCIGLNDLNKELSSLEKNSEKINSLIKKLPSNAPIKVNALEKKSKSLLSISSELHGFYTQLSEECR